MKCLTFELGMYVFSKRRQETVIVSCVKSEMSADSNNTAPEACRHVQFICVSYDNMTEFLSIDVIELQDVMKLLCLRFDTG